jgi:hypothetical protein
MAKKNRKRDVHARHKQKQTDKYLKDSFKKAMGEEKR